MQGSKPVRPPFSVVYVLFVKSVMVVGVRRLAAWTGSATDRKAVRARINSNVDHRQSSKLPTFSAFVLQPNVRQVTMKHSFVPFSMPSAKEPWSTAIRLPVLSSGAKLAPGGPSPPRRPASGVPSAPVLHESVTYSKMTLLT
jgi:hypothetical protein